MGPPSAALSYYGLVRTGFPDRDFIYPACSSYASEHGNPVPKIWEKIVAEMLLKGMKR